MTTITSPATPQARAAIGRPPSPESQERVSELLEQLETLAASPGRRDEPSAITALRQEATDHFRREGLPTTRMEAWRFTNPALAVRARTRPAPRRSIDELTAAERGSLQALLLPGCRNVLVLDGFPVEGLDDAGFSGAVRVRSLAASWGQLEVGESGLGGLARPAGPLTNAFALLNTAFFADGILIEAADRGEAPEPIHLLHLVSAGDRQEDLDADGVVPAIYPRTLIRAGAASQLTVIESYASLGDQRAVVCPVTEIYCGSGAALRHYRVTRESDGVLHLATQHLRLERDASASSLQLSWGGDLVRCDVHALLAGEGSDCVLDGLYLVGGRQHFDTHMRVEHLAPRCNSHELYKGVLDGAAHGVFDGRIYVHRSAQKTDAKQTNRNLLLSDRAVANSNPQLEIFADDVKCTHGSTVGQLEPEALFYLRSRGLDREAARSLLTYAFASELLSRIAVQPLREVAEAVLADRLTGGEVVGELRQPLPAETLPAETLPAEPAP
ncbi:MAG TPA: Fe-S cluster assembly protein SufD [Thermoanaerobaculia bacterium]|nr:Fe-S cluster assembly protein SufD [Thermoanaerobaculia bacterium]